MIDKLKKKDINLAEWEFEFQQRAEQPISLCDYFCRSLDQYLIHSVTGTPQHSNYLFTDSSKGYNHPSHKKFLLQELRKKVDDPVWLADLLRISVEFPQDFSRLAGTVSAVINNNPTNAELAVLWRNMDEEMTKIIPWFFIPYYVSAEDLLVNKVKEGLQKYRSQIAQVGDFDEVLMSLLFPLKKTGFQLEQDEMLKLVTIAGSKPNFSQDESFKTAAAEYLRKFDWLTTFILVPLRTMTYRQLVERVKRALAESFAETLAIQRTANAKNQALATQYMQLFAGDEPLLKAIADARELGYALTAGIEESYIISARYLPFMELVAKRIGVEYEDLKYLLSEEISTVLELGTTIAPETIIERRQGFIMVIKDGVQMAAFGPEAHAMSKWVDSHFSHVDDSVRELKGQPACKGFATGKARIALSPTDAHDIKEGEILVCPMTNPDYVPAMRRSAAIVTDEGGLLSHAAIMSREFGKPCVIATKIATQVLKDGDLVEVDANKGIVRIVERA